MYRQLTVLAVLAAQVRYRALVGRMSHTLAVAVAVLLRMEQEVHLVQAVEVLVHPIIYQAQPQEQSISAVVVVAVLIILLLTSQVQAEAEL